MLGLLASTIPLIPMKLSKLRSLCDKAIEKYGDLEIGGHITDEARDVEQYEDLRNIHFRVLAHDPDMLPGDSLEEESPSKEKCKRFAAIFVNY